MRALLLITCLLSYLCGFAQIHIQMEKEGGVYVVPCTVNGARMKFIFDTGAATVSLSKDMAEYLVENNYISKSDISGQKNFQDATGKISKKTIVNIRDIELGGLHIHNVEASISSSQNAPLLLGQSVIEKLGRITLQSNELIINSFDNINEINPVSFLGIKFGLKRKEVGELLKSRYGNSAFYVDKYTDGVANVIISTVNFDRAYLEYDENGIFASAMLTTDYNIKDIAKAKSDREKMAIVYKKKYPDLIDWKSESGFKGYSCGGKYYNEKENCQDFSINIYLHKSTDNNNTPIYTLTIRYYEGKTVNVFSNNDI